VMREKNAKVAANQTAPKTFGGRPLGLDLRGPMRNCASWWPKDWQFRSARACSEEIFTLEKNWAHRKGPDARLAGARSPPAGEQVFIAQETGNFQRWGGHPGCIALRGPPRRRDQGQRVFWAPRPHFHPGTGIWEAFLVLVNLNCTIFSAHPRFRQLAFQVIG